jgi:hypothetical protein
MQEHPVPQNITSYEFHLIGNMTLKQFFELAAGGLFAFLSYTSNLPDLLKWPLVFIFVILGVAFAFVPLEERPLDHWFLAFIRAIYNPTKFYWKKTVVVPDVFNFVKGAQPTAAQNEVEAALPRKRERAKAYFQSIAQDQAQDVDENAERANSLLGLFQYTQVDSVDAHHRQDTEKPSLEVSPHPIHAIYSMPAQAVDGTPAQTIEETPLTSATALISPVYAPPVDIPEDQRVSVKVEEKSGTVFDAQRDLGASVGAHQDQTTGTQAAENAVEAKTNANLPFPKTPTTPNLVVGMILDTAGKMVEQCIIEIRDKTGMPVRALRSNKLGQFFISTALPSGEYEVVVEKDGFTFDTMKLQLSGKIVEPLEIRAK